VTRAGAWALVLVLSACVHVESTTRTERGPLLRTFHRPQVVEGGVKAQVSAQWPALTVAVSGFDTCRDLTVEEYAEERITEHTAPAAGPAFSTGITGILGGAVLLAASFIVSDTPDLTSIDGAGHFGPSPRQLARGTAYLGFGIGLPALAVGVASMIGTGVDTENLKVEQVVDQKDTTCNDRPLSGLVELLGEDGKPVASKAAVDGQVQLTGTELSGEPDAVHFFGRKVDLDETSFRVLDAFAGCVALEKSGPVPPTLDALSDADLVVLSERLHRCRVLRKGELETETRRVEDEEQRRRELGATPAWEPRIQVSSFEEAMTAYAPKVTLEPKGKELAKLDAPAALVDQPVVLKGVIVQVLPGNRALWHVGDRDVLVSLTAKGGYGGELAEGVRAEAVAVGADSQELAGKTVPFFHAVWARPAY
jgi:hypothetical protein